jgi:tRNA threonylcarbamoyl adenosine modification protein (Sua5/YciO/YrdC/YwlC family)
VTLYLNIHPDDPQQRLVEQAAKQLREGAIAALPTDACYVLACHLGDKEALDRLRGLKGIDDRHHLTLMCRDLSEIAQYARVDNSQYRLLKSATPGAYTFILEGSKELPRRVLHPKRKTIGLRIPAHKVIQALLSELGEPLLTTTLQLPNEEQPLTEAWEIQSQLEDKIAFVVDSGTCGQEPTTVVDLTDSAPVLIREGCGSLQRLGL